MTTAQTIAAATQPGRVHRSPYHLPSGGEVGLLPCPVDLCANFPAPDQPLCRDHRSALPEEMVRALTYFWRTYLEDAVSAHKLHQFEAALTGAILVLARAEGT